MAFTRTWRRSLRSDTLGILNNLFKLNAMMRNIARGREIVNTMLSKPRSMAASGSSPSKLLHDFFNQLSLFTSGRKLIPRLTECPTELLKLAKPDRRILTNLNILEGWSGGMLLLTANSEDGMHCLFVNREMP